MGARLGPSSLLQRCLSSWKTSVILEVMTHELLLLHVAITWALVGLIWTIQIVHYPLFEQVGEDSFVTYHARHMWLITWVAGPLMLAEVGIAALLLFLEKDRPCSASASFHFLPSGHPPSSIRCDFTTNSPTASTLRPSAA